MRKNKQQQPAYAPFAADSPEQAAMLQQMQQAWLALGAQGYAPEQIMQMLVAQGYAPEQLAMLAQMQAAQAMPPVQPTAMPPLSGYTPEQLAQMQAASGYTPEQLAQMQATQAMPPVQPTAMPPLSGYSPEQVAQLIQLQQTFQILQSQGYAPEQIAQMLAAQGFAPEQLAQMQLYTPEQLAQAQLVQAVQLLQAQGCMPETVAQTLQAQGYAPEAVAQAQYEAYLAQTQQMPPPPSAQQPRTSGRARKPRKQKKLRQPLTRGALVLRVALIVALVGGMGWFLIRSFLPAGASVATIEMSEIGNVYVGDALIVRNETAFDEEGVQSIDYVAQEGGNVYLGDVVCYVYSTGYSTKETTALQDYRDQIKDYQRTLLKSETAYDQKMTRLESDVLERGLEVRSLVQGARGNLINQEVILETAIDQRQAYFRSKYSSDMRLNRLYDDEKTQQTRIESWIKQKVATEESIVSFYTDGFEYALSPSRYETYTPSQVRAMIGGSIPDVTLASRGRTNLYRLVKKNNYAVLLLIDSTTWNPVEGTTYKLVLEQFSNTIVDARVLSSTRAGGELLVRLAVIGDVTDVLYMRTCQAQIGEYVDCLVVPDAALYKQNDAIGVVLLTGQQQFFVPVKVLRQEGGKAYITAIQTGILTEGQSVRLFR